ncbi:MAG: hypothetical protein O2968_14415 [Acidobacteria bacterium]|nr:hypothetical protein [Acidobacteriota bacterium]
MNTPAIRNPIRRATVNAVLAVAISGLFAGPFAGTVAAADPFIESISRSATTFTASVPAIAHPAGREQSTKRKWKKAWIASWIAFAAVNALDAHSSQGRREGNPFLSGSDGRFSNRKAILLKSALGGGFFAWQAWTAKKNPEVNLYKTFTLTNTAVTGGLSAIAARNYSLPSLQATPAASMPLPDYLRRVE